MSLTTKTVVIAAPIKLSMASKGDDPMKPTLRLSQVPALERAVESRLLDKGSEFLLFVKLTPDPETGRARNCGLVLKLNRNTTARVQGAFPLNPPKVGRPISVYATAAIIPAYLA